ncbi:hypothetical protein AAEO57_18445 [Flavobacterium sp. DGU38]|uniref:Uncharacterized protein n=1 Tax=Flavobacterium calami TaxID=3139144 RepID=A0ABU9ITK4_9FLAO
MKKIVYIGLLIFLVHFFVLLGFLARLDNYVPKHYEGTGHAIFTAIAMFITFVIYTLTIILVIIENRMKFDYKGIMMFLVLGNCLQQFYINSFYQFRLFTRPESYDTIGKVIILTYFLFELILTFYVINRLYKSENN